MPTKNKRLTITLDETYMEKLKQIMAELKTKQPSKAIKWALITCNLTIIGEMLDLLK